MLSQDVNVTLRKVAQANVASQRRKPMSQANVANQYRKLSVFVIAQAVHVVNMTNVSADCFSNDYAVIYSCSSSCRPSLCRLPDRNR